MAESLRLLLVEDDLRLAGLITDDLSQQGFAVAAEPRGDVGLARIINEQPDLVILDLMLPGMDGLTVCRTARRHCPGPVLMLTAREDDTDQVVGLEFGADDYVKKPVEPRVLPARIRALLRLMGTARTQAGKEPLQPERLVFDSLVIDHASQRATLGGPETTDNVPPPSF